MNASQLQVLAAAFEQCQTRFQHRGGSIVGYSGELTQLRSLLGGRDVGGDQCDQLAQQVQQFSDGLQHLGGEGGVAGVAAALGATLDKFHEVDRRQAANASRLDLGR